MRQPSINIVAAESVSDYRLRLLFDDGMEQTVDFKPFLTHAHHPDLRSYLDPAQFSTFRIEYGDLVWGDYDLCFPIIDLYWNKRPRSKLRGIKRRYYAASCGVCIPNENQLEHHPHQEAAA